MRVALRRQEVIAALVGPEGEAEMRLTRIGAGELRKDGALLLDAIKARGFFPGPCVVFVEEAGDSLAPLVEDALKAWRAGDATLVITAGNLGRTSALKKLFESHPAAQSAAIYDDPPSHEEIEGMLRDAGLTSISRDAGKDLEALARTLDPGDFRQTIEKIALYKWQDGSPLTSDEVAASAPQTIEAEVDEVLNAAAEAEPARIAVLIRRLEGQGVGAVTLCIGAMRHFRTLHTAASAPGGPESGIGQLRPAVFGPRRDRMVRQAQRWGPYRLEQALAILTETDLTLRSTSSAPAMAVIERALIRLSILPR